MVCKWHLPHSVASLEGSDLVDEGSDVGHQGSADGPGPAATFRCPTAVATLADGSVAVDDCGSIRHVSGWIRSSSFITVAPVFYLSRQFLYLSRKFSYLSTWSWASGRPGRSSYFTTVDLSSTQLF